MRDQSAYLPVPRRLIIELAPIGGISRPGLHTLADAERIFEDGVLIAAHPVLEGRDQHRSPRDIGLVPRQFSSSDRTVLMGISKRGRQHLRSLLVHGARSVVRTAPKKTDLGNQWVNHLDASINAARKPIELGVSHFDPL